MTKQYFDISPEDSIYIKARAYPGGVEALAGRLGRSSNVLYKQLSPGVSSHHLSLDDFLRIMELCAEAGVEDAHAPLHAACFRLDHVAVRLPSFGSDCGALFQDVLQMLSEEGEVSKAINKALDAKGDAGSKITAAELAEVELHIERSLVALVAIKNELRERHKQDFPLSAPGGGGRGK